MGRSLVATGRMVTLKPIGYNKGDENIDIIILLVVPITADFHPALFSSATEREWMVLSLIGEYTLVLQNFSALLIVVK